MREITDPGTGTDADPSGERTAPSVLDPVAARIAAVEPGLTRLVAQARQAWTQRAGGTDEDPPVHLGEVAVPRWRPFEDAFPTFYQFTNKPR